MRHETIDSPRAGQDHLLVALRAAHLDRIRLMKTAFLHWHRRGRPAAGPFTFRPYLYGPCAFDLYGVLAQMEASGLVIQAQPSSSADYMLTETGRRAAGQAVKRLGERTTGDVEEIARWASRQTFHGLLHSVYAEAPDFATRSVLRR